MKLSKEQSQAMKLIIQWLNDKHGRWFFNLGGFAGTGKTYLLQHLINTMTVPIKCCTPTGKAASVLMSKLNNKKVTTIHKLLYEPLEKHGEKLDDLFKQLEKDPNNRDLIESIHRLQKDDVEFAFTKNEGFLENYMVIVDEASMVQASVVEDLQRSGAKVLFVGDPGQLPPVNSNTIFGDNGFDIVFEQVHRQALESPIIRLSMDIRNRSLKRSNYTSEDCRIETSDFDYKPLLRSYDQIITGMNKTRHSVNIELRQAIFGEAMNSNLPIKGDKIICVKNTSKVKGSGKKKRFEPNFINGVMAEVIKDPVYDKNDITMMLAMQYEDQVRKNVETYTGHFIKNYDSHVKPVHRDYLKGIQEFDYGYCITAHKSQGSEWGSVMVVDDKLMRQDREFRVKWLYTAVTRAKDQLLLVT